MKNVKTLLMAALLTTSFTAVSADDTPPYTGSRIFWDTSTRKTVFANGGYARLIQLQDGRLMATSESNGIVIAFSTDQGSTWSDPVRIASNHDNINECVPDLIQLSDGTIIVAYNPRPNEPYTDDRLFGIRCKRSTDNGQTWSDEIFVNDAQSVFSDGCWEPSMLELPSGELQLYFADEGPYTTNNDQQISMCRSFDGGVTWDTPVRICYRAGSRDGMPVPVLLNDNETIVVAIEDNGWPDVGDFIPTTVRCPLSVNWNRFWVNAGSTSRSKMVDYDFCPVAKGGAPYLRVLPWGETVASHQSNMGGGNFQMYVYVGDEEARGFKAMSTPFNIGANEYAMWNSLAVIDTGTVVAVGGVSGRVEMIKGYPVRQLTACYASPTVDGVQTTGEGYVRPDATQVILGTQNGNRVTSDFAYDSDSLYFTARVTDNTQITDGSQCDGVRLLLDIDNVCGTKPQQGMFKIFFGLGGTCWKWQGDNGRWKIQEPDGINNVVSRSDTYYVVEAAVPWSCLGQTAPPAGRRMALAVEAQDRQENTVVTECIPDARQEESWTWMEFRLAPMPEDTGISDCTDSAPDGITIDADGRTLHVRSTTDMSFAGIYASDGRMTGCCRSGGRSFSAALPHSGIALVRLSLADGRQFVRKVSVK